MCCALKCLATELCIDCSCLLLTGHATSQYNRSPPSLCEFTSGSCSQGLHETQAACVAAEATFIWKPATCDTRQLAVCGTDSQDQTSCEAAGDCTWDTSNANAACATTTINGCATANADEDTCEDYKPPVAAP